MLNSINETKSLFSFTVSEIDAVKILDETISSKFLNAIQQKLGLPVKNGSFNKIKFSDSEISKIHTGEFFFISFHIALKELKVAINFLSTIPIQKESLLDCVKDFFGGREEARDEPNQPPESLQSDFSQMNLFGQIGNKGV